jgi:hypothetical protein
LRRISLKTSLPGFLPCPIVDGWLRARDELSVVERLLAAVVRGVVADKRRRNHDSLRQITVGLLQKN